MFFEDELIALRDQNKAHADAVKDDPDATDRDLFSGVTVMSCVDVVSMVMPCDGLL